MGNSYVQNIIVVLKATIHCFFSVGILCVFLFNNALGQTEVTDYQGNKVSIEGLIKLSEEKEKVGDFRQASDYLNKAAMIEWEHNQYKKAIKLYEKSLSLNSKINNQQGIMGITSNLAMIHADMKAYDEAYRYFKITLEGRQGGSDKVSIISAHINLSIVLNNLFRHDEAATHLEEALDLAREMSDANQMKSCYGMLSETYEKAGNNEKSLHYFNLYRTFHEMVQKDKEEVYRQTAKEAELKAQLLKMSNENKQMALQLKHEELEKTQGELKRMESLMSQFDDEKRKLIKKASRAELIEQLLEDKKIIHEEELRVREAEIAKQNIIQYSLLVGLGFILVFIAVMYRRYQERKKTNLALKEKNDEITAQQEQLAAALGQITHKNTKITQSINYAQKIQTAMLDHRHDLSSMFSESFIMFKPKDIVSGDFFWFAKKDGLSIVAAVDCTGHGVPGAFMSMIGVNLLNQIVSEGITSPDEILTKLDVGVKESLHQEDTKNKDGMDMAIYTYDPKKQLIEFAGAKNPLLYIQNNEIHVIKGAKQSIGWSIHKRSNEFTKHTVDVSTPTSLYMFSDGLQDQFGGPDNRKFMIKRLKNRLLEIHHEPMKKQHELLNETLAEWRGQHEQIDDILVIGTKI